MVLCCTRAHIVARLHARLHIRQHLTTCSVKFQAKLTCTWTGAVASTSSTRMRSLRTARTAPYGHAGPPREQCSCCGTTPTPFCQTQEPLILTSAAEAPLRECTRGTSSTPSDPGWADASTWSANTVSVMFHATCTRHGSHGPPERH